MHRRSWVAVSTVILVAGSLVACAEDAPTPVPTPTPYVAPPESSLPSELLGNWRVESAGGEEDGSWIAIGDLESVLHRACGDMDFAWNAAPDVVIFDLTGGSGDCFTPGAGLPVAAWLTDARGYAVDGNRLTILDADGVPTATLIADLALPGIARPTSWSRWEVAAGELDGLPAPIPEGRTAATTRELLGTWVPEGWTGGYDPALTFTADGRWDGKDCNGAGGKFLLAPDGLLLSTDAGFRTAIGCLAERYGMDMVLSTVRRAAIDGDRLSLFDQYGTLLTELIRRG